MEALQKTIYFSTDSGQVMRKTKPLQVLQEKDLTKVVESKVLGIYPDYTYQTVEGFGCAMTETACYLLSKMSPETRKEALSCWFGPDGMDAQFIRMHIDSCDYSLTEYQAVEDPIEDPELKTLNIERDKKYMIPVVKEAMALAGHPLSILLSPWSPPKQWKTPPELSQNDAQVYGGMGQQVDLTKPGRCFGGRLKPEFYGAWAKYLVKYIKLYLAEGLNVTMLSIQNEASAATNWDSCLWSAAQEKEFLQHYLYPAMKAEGLTDKIEIFIWDHNKERMIEHIDEMMDDTTMQMVSGFAYHWYSGDHFEALQMMHEHYPDKILMHSESCGLHVPGKTTAFEITEEAKKHMPPEFLSLVDMNPLEMDFNDAVAYAHDLIGDINHGMQRWIDWNLCVDRTGGPRHVPGGFAAPIVAEDDGSFSKTVSFAYLELIAKTVKRDAVRIGNSLYGADVEAAAVKNPDGSIGIIILNSHDKDVQINIREKGRLCTADIPAKTLSSIIIAK